MKLTEHKGRFLKAIDVGKGMLVTIRDATNEQMQDGEHKDVLWFLETEQGLVLNKINAATVVSLTSTDDSDQMMGHKIVLYATQTDFGGKMVDCIRVRAPKLPAAPEPPPSVTEEGNDDDLPF